MNQENARFGVLDLWLIFRGDDLNPELISRTLGLVPTKTAVRGSPKPHFPRAIAKTGLWKLQLKSKIHSLPKMIEEITRKIQERCSDLRQIDGVEEMFIDIFSSKTDDDGNHISVTTVISNDQLLRLSKLGLAIHFTS